MGVITYLSSFLYQDSDGEQSQKHFFLKTSDFDRLWFKYCSLKSD